MKRLTNFSIIIIFIFMSLSCSDKVEIPKRFERAKIDKVLANLVIATKLYNTKELKNIEKNSNYKYGKDPIRVKVFYKLSQLSAYWLLLGAFTEDSANVVPLIPKYTSSVVANKYGTDWYKMITRNKSLKNYLSKNYEDSFKNVEIYYSYFKTYDLDFMKHDAALFVSIHKAECKKLRKKIKKLFNLEVLKNIEKRTNWNGNDDTFSITAMFDQLLQMKSFILFSKAKNIILDLMVKTPNSAYMDKYGIDWYRLLILNDDMMNLINKHFREEYVDILSIAELRNSYDYDNNTFDYYYEKHPD